MPAKLQDFPNLTAVFNADGLSWYHYLNLAAVLVFLANIIWHLVKIIRGGKPVDYSTPTGAVSSAVVYSFTGAMSPKKKESAYLHLPTYTAGIIYHLGTFLAIACWVLSWFLNVHHGTVFIVSAALLVLSGACGVGILLKRVLKKELRELSNPDDYISNILVTLFQVITSICIVYPSTAMLYYLVISILLFYFPASKLKHALYFFAARYHLGFFYGWRGIWPPKMINSNTRK